MTTSTITSTSIVLLMLIGAACGSNESSKLEQPGASAAGAPAAVRDACALISADEAGKILGSPAKATPRSTSAGRSTCDYITDSFESFTLEAIWNGAEGEIKGARTAAVVAAEQAGGAADKVVSEVMGLQRVENLGDEAYFSRRAMSYVRKGDVLLVFQNAGLNEPAREHWEALARAALTRF